MVAIRRRVFFSFHYKPDNWRAAEVRNMGVVEGNPPASDNDWESVTQGGDTAIRNWINSQMYEKSCSIVLIGSQTAGRKWIKTTRSRRLGMTARGCWASTSITSKDRLGNQSAKGRNPFVGFTVGEEKLADIVRAYDPPYKTSTYVYAHIKDNIADWIEDAIRIRGRH